MPTQILSPETIGCKPNALFCESCKNLTGGFESNAWRCRRFGQVQEQPNQTMKAASPFYVAKQDYVAVIRHPDCVQAECRCRMLKSLFLGLFKKSQTAQR